LKGNLKRKPTLADEFIESNLGFVHKKQIMAAKQDLLEAKRFVLDESAALYVAEMITEYPRIIADAQDFAIPPFTKTWIEFPFTAFWETINKIPSDATADSQIGFLITGNRVRVVVGGKSSLDASLMPHEYYLWHPMTVEEELEFVQRVGTSRLQLDFLYWGEAVNKLIDEKDKEGLRALRENHRIHYEETDPERAKMVWDKIIMQSGGDLRNIIAVLLFLNRTREIQVVDAVPHARGMIKNKASTYLSYHKIGFKLNPEPLLKKLVPGEGTWRKLHDVRGHFCHDKRSREAGKLWCGHEWVEYEPLKWVCHQCYGKRWWRHEHKRGNEEKGLVMTEYQVTK
jgi:hypothetical protein